MAIQNVFRRHEIKYLVTSEQRKRITDAMTKYMVPDEYGRSTVCSVYYDTPDKLLIRRSIEGPLYKEKLRVRSYGTAKDGDRVFVEIKKKYKHVTYKRRVGLELREAERWLSGTPPERTSDIKPSRAQIMNEIDYFLSRYNGIEPSVFISAEREAFYAKDDHEFRLTFDDNILWRDTELSLSSDVYGAPLLEAGTSLMEIKVGAAYPLWICRLLSEEGLFKTKFSKYGLAYKSTLAAEYLFKGETENDGDFQRTV